MQGTVDAIVITVPTSLLRRKPRPAAYKPPAERTATSR
jgi:hypothetical protein